ncbi:MAG: hypothetical protein ACYST5_22190 [Planctomycetota bacterium]
MSLKNTQNLLIIGAVVAALLAGTILLGNYASILPADSDSGAQAEAAQATDQPSCPMAKAHFAEAGDVKACPREAAAGLDAKTCPLGSGANACPPGCTKPCCAEEAEGCCPKKAEGCCPKVAESCCPKEAASSCPKEAKTCSE